MTPSPPKMPVVFIGHGSPMNTLQQNRYTDAWRKLGAAMPRPRAVLAISAHWYVGGTAATAMERPRTIHDFGGFPRELFEFEYPAAGEPALASRVRELLAPVEVAQDRSWGLDHGTWSVLAHVFPDAGVPVVQLAIDAGKPAAFHYALGRRLAALRDEGVLILGSGNVVHNLGLADWRPDAAPLPWAARFNDLVRDRLARRDHEPLIAWESLGADARQSIPTPEHYLPLLYCIALQEDGDAVDFPVDGIDLGSIGMLAVAIGAPARPA
jgi:4,5-DOPA dioxygenase extradiol